MKIVILDGYTANPGDLSWAELEKLGELTVYDRTPGDQVAPRIGDAEIAVTNKVRITAETMAACPNLRCIGVLATGYDVIDMAAAQAKGITVTNVPGYSTPAVAQHAIALLLELCSHVALNAASPRSGWNGTSASHPARHSPASYSRLYLKNNVPGPFPILKNRLPDHGSSHARYSL